MTMVVILVAVVILMPCGAADSQLALKGFAGQRMRWTLFFFPGPGIPDVDLSGLAGEVAEFSEVHCEAVADQADAVSVTDTEGADG
jgi:hypothetical protein